ncbi:BTB/POZ domain-containing protein KCTD7 isoform 2-T8 [Clarias gariepinus]|uniref:BTB/POZ domain-containing protein KCTD7 isoform X2 n=1 Tax=Clarias gariepinus TaxID=13013 RepID=UPI00234DA95F|nr:BTB/POZ domain-containing protein KCTD7 isoform X2 [Clarias gariepinus]XP_053331877.1 BTB/POZ domain-containing protein KCTD7 isoform X2 [Clarias gariepinus]XP_053331878.1 BTB/POZ domain-containing protein KCTD7 isoform X2 [Clarias gariepinus]
MQQNGAGETPNGAAGPLSPLSAVTSVTSVSTVSTVSSAALRPASALSCSPSPSPRMRRLHHEARGAPPQPTVMVVLSAARDPEPAGDLAVSRPEEERRRPAGSVLGRSLPKAARALPAPQEFPEVIPLNVGGTYFTTRLSTLRRYEDTMLAAMFSGRHHIPRDADGRYFIDRDGAYFGDILNFLREGELPQRERVRAVHREAQYYSIGPLLDSLEDRQPLTGEKVRQAFLDLLPYYKDNLERIVEIAKLRAMQRKARFAKLKICVYKEEMPITPYERPLFNSLRFERSESEAKLFEHHCEVDVSFGPWEAVADVYDLLHCIVSDLAERGITVDQQCIGDHVQDCLLVLKLNLN